MWAATRGRRAAIVGVALLVLVALAELATGDEAVLLALLVVGPLVAAARARTTQVAAVAAAGLALALPLGAVDGIFLETQHVTALVAIAVCGILAVVVARYRDEVASAAVSRRHMTLLSRLSELLEAPAEPELRLRHIAALLADDLADLVVIDLVGMGEAIAASRDPAAGRRLEDVRRRAPLPHGGEHPAMAVLRTGRPLLRAEVSDDDLRRWAAGEAHLQLMRELRYRSFAICPLISEGRSIGALSALRLGDAPPFTPEDLVTLEAFSARAAAAVASAQLHAGLRESEARLDAILANLAEAVLALEPDGRFAFANSSALALLGLTATEEIVGREPEDVIPGFEAADEQGRPVALRDLPYVAALAGEQPEPATIRAAYPDGSERWFVVRAAPVRADDGPVTLVVAVVEDVTAARRAEQRQRLLADASGLLGSSLDVETTLEKTAWAAVPELADWARLDMPDERGRLREVAVAHRDPAKLELLREWRRDHPPDPSDTRGPWEVLRTGRPVSWPSVSAEDIARYARDERHAELMRAIDTRSMHIVPLMAGDEVIGTLQLATTGDSGRRLGPEDLDLALELARRAAVAVENARVHAARSHVASTLQRSLLPPRLPEIPGLQTAARFRATGGSDEVGGDFYDVFAAASGWMVVMGDVTGKGPEAASITSLARYTMRTAALYEQEPDRVLQRLNDVLLHDGDDRRQLCTAVCAHLVTVPGGIRVVLACAGHPAPYLLRAGGELQAAGPPGTLLGAWPDARFTPLELQLAPGDALVLFTDGVTDARSAAGRFGHERLEQELRRLAGAEADAIAAALDGAVLAFQDGPQRDDVALLVLRARTPS
ncbi:MAG TPA: SpoIIE family protein phosphatase [Baekduia sp.]|nr:SpoIIE family protein phosphatase [Baekduia sp.]